MENSNRIKELDRKLLYLKTLIKDYEDTKQELDAIEEDRPKFTPTVQKQNALKDSQKWLTQRTYSHVNVPKYNSKYVLNKTKGISSLSTIPFQNNMSIQYKNAKTTLINKTNSSKNNLSVQYKSARTTLINKINSPKNEFNVQYKNSKTTLINKVNFPKNDLQVQLQLKKPKSAVINKISSPKNELNMQDKNARTALISKVNFPKNDLRIQVQFKNPKKTCINKFNSPKNELSVQFKNPKSSTTSKIIPSKNALCSVQEKKLIHERNLGLRLDILSPKCTTEPCTKNSDNSTDTTEKLISVANKISPTKFVSKVVDIPKVSQNSNNTVKPSSVNSNVPNCASKPPSAYSQLLNDIISVTNELKQSTKDCDTYTGVKSSIVTKTGNLVEKHPLTDNRKMSNPAITSNLKTGNKSSLCSVKLRKSNPVDDLKSVKLKEITHLEMKNKLGVRSSTTVSPQSSLLSRSSISLSKVNEAIKARKNSNSSATLSPQSSLLSRSLISLSKVNEAIKARRNSNRKIFSSQYKVVNKNSRSHVQFSALKLVKNKATDSKSICLMKMNRDKQYSPKLRNVLNTKYKIINKTARNSTSITPVQSSSRKKIHTVHKLVNNSCNSPSPSFRLRIPEKAVKRVIYRTPKMKACKVVNITPIFKLAHNVKNKANVSGSHHKNSVKRPQVVNSKYKVVNKLPTPKRSIFINKSVFKINSQKKSDRIQRFIAERMARIHQKSTPKPVLLKRLYKSKNKIINKNSSPVAQTAKMIKTKYVALYKQRSLPPHKQFIAGRSKMFRGHHLRPFYNKPRHVKHGYYSAAFHNPRSMRFLSTNRYSKINMQVKRSFLRKQRFMPARYAYRSKFAIGHGKTSYKSSKLVAPVSQILASRVLHRSINQAVIKSTRKNLKKVNTYCMFYNRFGKCNKGIKCSFIHDPSKIAVCTRFLRGTCKSESCPFSHEISPGKMALCTYYLLGSCENDKCPYRHESLSPNADLCKEFVQGYCSKGRKCDKAHLLICPHYVKGDCDKGDKCLFPHPPQKAKKSTPQDVKEITHAKESEELFLENVSRYFQIIAEELASSTSSNSSEDYERIIVRRSRLLPEQPSFIPLS